MPKNKLSEQDIKNMESHAKKRLPEKGCPASTPEERMALDTLKLIKHIRGK